jgi:hypothetical protein
MEHVLSCNIHQSATHRAMACFEARHSPMRSTLVCASHINNTDHAKLHDDMQKLHVNMHFFPNMHVRKKIACQHAKNACQHPFFSEHAYQRKIECQHAAPFPDGESVILWETCWGCDVENRQTRKSRGLPAPIGLE